MRQTAFTAPREPRCDIPISPGDD